MLAARLETVMGIGSGSDPGLPDREGGVMRYFGDSDRDLTLLRTRKMGAWGSVAIDLWLQSSHYPINHLLRSRGAIDGQFSRGRLLETCPKHRKQTTGMI